MDDSNSISYATYDSLVYIKEQAKKTYYDLYRFEFLLLKNGFKESSIQNEEENNLDYNTSSDVDDLIDQWGSNTDDTQFVDTTNSNDGEDSTTPWTDNEYDSTDSTGLPSDFDSNYQQYSDESTNRINNAGNYNIFKHFLYNNQKRNSVMKTRLASTENSLHPFTFELINYQELFPDPTPTKTPSSSRTPTKTPSATPTVTPTPGLSNSATPTTTPSISISPTVTPSISISNSVTPTITPSLTKTPSPSRTPNKKDIEVELDFGDSDWFAEHNEFELADEQTFIEAWKKQNLLFGTQNWPEDHASAETLKRLQSEYFLLDPNLSTTEEGGFIEGVFK